MPDNITTIIEISNKMSLSMDIEEILPEITYIVKKYMGVERASVFLYENGNLVLKAYAGFDPGGNLVKSATEGVSGQVFQSNNYLLVNNKASDDISSNYTATSFLSLPITLKGKPIGVLNLTDKVDDFFDTIDLRIAQYIANQCSLSIERYDLYQNMKRTERLRAISVLRISAVHDIKNLLSVVETYLELMDGESDEVSLKEYVDAIKVEVSNVKGLTEDIVEYSKQNITLNYETFNLNTLCSNITHQLNISLKLFNNTIVFKAKNDINISADKDRLFRVIFNLVNNASQSIKDGKKGVIILRIKSYGSDFVVITVCDNGSGIPKKVIKNIFDPFFTSGKAKGSGLGLAIVKEVVSAHKGRLEVCSKVSKGTIFKIYLPRKKR